MQHLDDALIAEWVDGAIDQDSPQHSALAAHIERCEECRSRVDEERALAGHVRQILGVAAPPERIPAFEEVLHRAGAAPRRTPRPTPWLRRLAMAATVVVAGGVGWYARGLVVGTAGPAGPAESVVAAVEGDAAGTTGTTGTAGVTGTAGATGTTGMAAGRAVATEEAPAAAAKRLEVAAADAPGRGAADADARQLAERAEAQRETMTDEVRAQDQFRAARRDAGAAPASPPPAEPRPMAQVAATAENELGLRKAAREPWSTIARPDAERLLGRSLLYVEGIPVAGLDVSADSAAVRVRQDLGSGAVLELIQSRASAVEGLAAAAGAVSAEPRARESRTAPVAETTTIDGITVTARGPVSGDSLRRLMATLRK